MERAVTPSALITHEFLVNTIFHLGAIQLAFRFRNCNKSGSQP